MTPPHGRASIVLIGLLLVCISVLGIAIYTQTRGPDRGNLTEAERAELKRRQAEATTLLTQAKLDAAEPIVNQLAKRWPNDAENHRLLAQVAMQKAARHKNEPEQHDKLMIEAYQHARKSLELNAAQADVHELVGTLAFGRKQYEIAKHHYFQAVELDKNNPRLPLYLAQVMIHLNDLANANLQLARALSLDQNNPNVYAARSDFFAKKNDREMALDQINRAIQLAGPDHAKFAAFTIAKARLLRQYGEPALALSTLRGMPAEHHRDPLIIRELADTYMVLARPMDAGDTWAARFDQIGNQLSTAAQRADATEAAAMAGKCYLSAGERALARRYRILAERIDPTHKDVKALAEAMFRSASVE